MQIHKPKFFLPRKDVDFIRRHLTCPVVLVGLMGTGKTTIGRRLAKALKLDFVDSDDAIEEAAGMCVSDIFSSFGEAEFRAGERRVMARLITEGPGIVATGGGTFVDDATRALIKEKAIAVWLRADIPVLAERTSRRDTRPLLRGGDRSAILTDLAEKRQHYYGEAPIHIESTVGPHQAIVASVVKALAAHLRDGAS